MTGHDHIGSSFPRRRRAVLSCVGAVGVAMLSAPVTRPRPPDGAGPTAYASYWTVTDGAGCISATAPAAWHRTAVAGHAETGLALAVSPQPVTAPTTFTLRAADRTEPGALVVYLPEFTGEPAQFSSATREFPLGCTATDRVVYTTDRGLDGVVTVHGGCPDTDALVLKYVASTSHADGIVLATVTVAADRDVEAALRFLDTLTVDPGRPVR